MAGRKNSNSIAVYTYNSSGAATDGKLTNSSIEIRVYS